MYYTYTNTPQPIKKIMNLRDRRSSEKQCEKRHRNYRFWHRELRSRKALTLPP